MSSADKPLTDTQLEVLRVASHHDKISQSRLNAYANTVTVLVQHGYLEQIIVPYSELYYRITVAGRAMLSV